MIRKLTKLESGRNIDDLLQARIQVAQLLMRLRRNMKAAPNHMANMRVLEEELLSWWEKQEEPPMWDGELVDRMKDFPTEWMMKKGSEKEAIRGRKMEQ
jgi:hypothetical protein